MSRKHKNLIPQMAPTTPSPAAIAREANFHLMNAITDIEAEHNPKLADALKAIRYAQDLLKVLRQ